MSSAIPVKMELIESLWPKQNERQKKSVPVSSLLWPVHGLGRVCDAHFEIAWQTAVCTHLTPAWMAQENFAVNQMSFFGEPGGKLIGSAVFLILSRMWGKLPDENNALKWQWTDGSVKPR